jgi:hypothetical protein
MVNIDSSIGGGHLSNILVVIGFFILVAGSISYGNKIITKFTSR